MRVFADQSGTEWTVWEVRPMRGIWTDVERRSGRDRRSTMVDGRLDRRTQPERRAAVQRVIETLGPALADGWLAFQAGSARRRLAPIPDGWMEMRDAELAELCCRADCVGPSYDDAHLHAPASRPTSRGDGLPLGTPA
jgi:hypothetical protein